MGICPLSNEPCDNLKSECIYENINGVKTELNLCKNCSVDYLRNPYFKTDYLEIFEKNKELQHQEELQQQQLKIREIKFLQENKPSLFSIVKGKVSNFINRFSKKKSEPDKEMNLEKMKNLYYRVKNDQAEDFQNKNIKEAAGKGQLLNEIKADLKLIKRMQRAIIEASDKEEIEILKRDINDIMLKYLDLYNELFS